MMFEVVKNNVEGLNVAIIVTAFNPNIDEFKQNLESYCYQVGLVVVCDNSNNDISRNEIIALVKNFENVVLLSMGGNLGIATAQNKGAQYAINQNFEYLLEMDQDSMLPYNYVSEISSSYYNLSDKGFNLMGIGGAAMDSSGDLYDKIKHNNSPLVVRETLSSGFFFSIRIFDLIGWKDESLFIDYVDWEWCWRASKFGLKTYVKPDLYIKHKLGLGYRKILWLNVGIPSPIRHYYQYRNSIKLFCYCHAPLLWRFKRIFVNLVKLPLYIFLFLDGEKRKYFIFKGIKDGLRNKSGSFEDNQR